ncbi:MAG: DUF5700 domain-containing putative Zn-dependent protease [Bacteroidota bacterium]
MKKLFTIGFCLLLCGCNTNTDKKQMHRNPIDFESVDAYYDLLEKLENEESITDTQWDDFINLKGNKLYIEENNIPTDVINLIRDEMTICYDPKNDSILSSKLSNDIRFQIRKRYQTNKDAYTEHIQWLKKNTRTLQDSALRFAKEYLPEKMHQLDTFPNIFFHGLWDGSANNKGIFVDIILQYDFDKRRLGSFIAHELHHFMMKSDIDLLNVEAVDKGILWAIISIQTEGVADMVDKSSIVYEHSDWWLNDQYMAFLNYAEPVIVELNQYMIDESNSVAHSESEYRQVLQNSVGHLPGQYMAEKIKQNGRLQEVIDEIHNPFTFFFIYNEIAVQKGKIPYFSKAAIDYLKVLEQKYIAGTYN